MYASAPLPPKARVLQMKGVRTCVRHLRTSPHPDPLGCRLRRHHRHHRVRGRGLRGLHLPHDQTSGHRCCPDLRVSRSVFRPTSRHHCANPSSDVAVTEKWKASRWRLLSVSAMRDMQAVAHLELEPPHAPTRPIRGPLLDGNAQGGRERWVELFSSDMMPAKSERDGMNTLRKGRE